MNVNLPHCEVIAEYKDLDEATWLKLRHTGIGGSDAGAVLGYNKYKSAFTVAMEKTGRYVPKDISGEEVVAVGNIMEPIIRRQIMPEYLKEQGIEAQIIDPEAMYRSLAYPYVIINPDGFILLPNGKMVGLEIKTGSSYTLPAWGGRGGDLVPDSYYAQVQHYMGGTGLDEWWVFGMIGNERIFRIVPRNEKFLDDLLAAEGDLWEAIETNDPLNFPLPGGTEADQEAIMALGLPQVDETADLDDSRMDIQRYIDLGVEIKDREEERKRLRQKIQVSLGQYKYGDTSLYRITNSVYSYSTLDKTKLKKDYPEIVEQYSKQSEASRLFIKSKL